MATGAPDSSVSASGATCATCGNVLRPGTRFCVTCGRPSDTLERPPGPAGADEARRAGPTAALARGASVASTVGALPWQVLVGDQTPNLAALVRAAGTAAPTVARRVDLRAPALSLAATAGIDLLVMLLLGDVDGYGLGRVGCSAGAALLGGVVGRGAGPLRGLTAVVSLAAAGVQAASLIGAELGTQTVIAAVTIVSGMVAALSSAWGALRS